MRNVGALVSAAKGLQVVAAISFLALSEQALAQRAYYGVDAYPYTYNSGLVYRTHLDAYSAMRAHVLTFEAGSYVAPWYYGRDQVWYRVPPGPLAGYSFYDAYWIVGTTPTEACQLYGAEMGFVVRDVYLNPNYYNGKRTWSCKFEAINEPGFFRWRELTPMCTAPFASVANDDLNGEWVCGGAFKAVVGYVDAGPERPDECPAEGNPILPNTGQKVQYDTDYDNGNLRFTRYYASLRTGIGSSAALSHSFNPLIQYPQSTGPAYRRADGVLAWLTRPTAGWKTESPDLPFTVNPLTDIDGQRTFVITSPFEPVADAFDTSGRLVARTRANGLIHRLTYANGSGGFLPGGPACVLPPGSPIGPYVQAAGTLQCATDPFGRQLNFLHDGAGRLVKMIDPGGGAFDFVYDEASSYVVPGQAPGNNLTSVRYPDGSVRVYHYNEPANTEAANLPRALTGISELIGPSQYSRFATFKYNAGGLAISTEHAGGADRSTLAYSTDLSQVTVTRPLGATFTHSFTTLLGVGRRTATQQPPGAGSSTCNDARTFDTQGNVVSSLDFKGNKTCFLNDTQRRLEVVRVEGLSAGATCTTEFTSPPAGARVISTQWHPDWRFETRIAEPKKLTTITYNGQGATCAPSAVLVDGKPPAVVCSRSEQATTDETGASGFGATTSGAARTWSYTYTTYGRVLTATDPNGKTTTTSYHPDDDPDLGRRGNIATVTNAAGHITRYTAYNAHGQPTQIIDPNGLVTDLTYDLRQRLTSRKVGNELTTFIYDPVGQLTNVTLPDGASVTYTYDAAHRLTGIQDHKGSWVVYTLDAMGNRINEQLTDPGGTLVKNIQRSIDVLNRVQQITGALQ